MTAEASTWNATLRADLAWIVEGTFTLYVLISFLCVAAYTARQVQAKQLLNNGKAPPPLVVPHGAGWFFIVSVLALVYLQSPLYAVVAVLGTASMLVLNGRTAGEQFGLSRMPPLQVLRWALLVFGALMLVEEPLIKFATWMLDIFQVPHPEQQSVETFRQYSQFSAIVLFLSQAVLLYPLIEEIFFRGFLLTYLKRYTSTWLAVVLSAGIFAFAHVNLGAVLPLWFLGIVLALAYEHTGCLLLPMGIHACFNLATGLSLLMDKGSTP
jgi:membrane protease YdiL (CAAX protease family)